MIMIVNILHTVYTAANFLNINKVFNQRENLVYEIIVSTCHRYLMHL